LVNSKPLEFKGNYSATSNNMKLVHWPLWWAVTFGTARRWLRGPACTQPAQAPCRCTKCNSPPINGHCTNYHIAV